MHQQLDPNVPKTRLNITIHIIIKAKYPTKLYIISDINIESLPVLDIGQCTALSRKLAVVAFAESEATHKEMGRKCWIAFDKKDK